MVNLVVLVTLLGLGYVSTQPAVGTARCDQLPKVNADIKKLIGKPPFTIHYAINSVYECAIALAVGPQPGKRGYDGTIFAIQTSSVVSFDFTSGADNKTTDFTDCNSGQRSTWFTLGAKITPTGGWSCAYTCSRDGLALDELICLASDNSFLRDESQAVALARGVQNWDNVKDVRLSCSAPKFCHLL